MKPEIFLNSSVATLTGVAEKKGQLFGLELELEGRNVGLADVATRGWRRTHDGSLRGESTEYVFNAPKTLKDAKDAVLTLFGKFENHKVRFNNSIRTSTHVHLNFSDKPVKHVINFFTLFTMFEELLQHYSGEDRKGNLFCISCREAEGIVDVLSKAIEQGTLVGFNADRFKYAACNLCTLFKFGTVEVRTMKGAVNAEHVNNWIDINNDLYEYAVNKMKSPVDLIEKLSLVGADVLMRDVFSPHSYRELMGAFPKDRELHYSLMDGARILQVLAYQFEEAFTKVVEMPKVPKAKAKAGGRLPRLMPNGGRYTVYLPNGDRWLCQKSLPGEFWLDGEILTDNNKVKWNQALQRFVVFRNGLGLVPLRWSVHHEFRDEGRPDMADRFILAECMRFFNEPQEADENFEIEVEPDWDFDEDDD